MGFLNWISLVIDNLSRRKARVALTAVGVVIGTASVVILVSLGVGLQKNAASQLGGIGDLTIVRVWPTYGDGGSGPPGDGSGRPGQMLLTEEAAEQIRQIPGVQTVVLNDYLRSWSMLRYNRLEGYGQIIGTSLTDLSELGLRPEAGSLQIERGSVVIGSWVPRYFYNPRQRPGEEPPEPPDLLGKQIEIILFKYVPEDGTEIRKTIRARVAGIITEIRDEPDGAIYMPMAELDGYNAWIMGKRIDHRKEGYSGMTVKVASIDQVTDVAEQINALGYQAWTPQTIVEGINSFYLVLQVVFGGVGAIALLVAAIGIANTMAMAILERTREIGLMKAVGATNRNVLSVFLGEAAGIGFIGGLGGVLTGWSLGQVLNVLAMAYLAGQAAQNGTPPPTVAVLTPSWLPPFCLAFATVIGLLSGLYPALSAATLTPVNALKYE